MRFHVLGLGPIGTLVSYHLCKTARYCLRVMRVTAGEHLFDVVERTIRELRGDRVHG